MRNASNDGTGVRLIPALTPHVGVRAARRSPTITAFLGSSGCWTSMGGQAHPLGKPVPE
jgi:hypothetical protein